MTISVDIGNPQGETADILIREGDDPATLAAEFAARHGIKSRELVELLAEQIQVNLEAVLKEEEESRAARHPSPPDVLVGGSLDNRQQHHLMNPTTTSQQYLLREPVSTLADSLYRRQQRDSSGRLEPLNAS